MAVERVRGDIITWIVDISLKFGHLFAAINNHFALRLETYDTTANTSYDTCTK